MSEDKINVNVQSEIGELEAVIIHTPGPEVENMTPENAARALYSDILNLSVALPEYNEFKAILEKVAKVFDVKDLLNDILGIDKVRNSLASQICSQETADDACALIENLSNEELARQLIEGVEMRKNTLTKYLDDERFSLHPLPNFFLYP